MNQLCVPNTNLKITDGTLVQLSRFPGMKWVVHEGWYTYNNSRLYGWYFSSIPAQTIIPMNDEDLRTLQFVSTSKSLDYDDSSNNCGCGCGHPSDMYPQPGVDNCYPHPKPFEIPFDIKKDEMLNRAWITVDTIAQRDKLNKCQIPDGKIIRVNRIKDIDGPRYYAWSTVNQDWEEVFQKVDLSGYVLKSDLDTEVKNSIDKLDIPNMVSTEVESSEEIKNIINSSVSDSVKTETDEFNKQLDELTNEVKEITLTWAILPSNIN